MFARRNDAGNYDLFHDDGDCLTIAPDDWPIIWPVDSDVSAFHEHPEGITLPDYEYVKIAPIAPLE